MFPWRQQAGVIEGITPKMLKVRLADSDQQVGRLQSGWDWLMDSLVVESHQFVQGTIDRKSYIFWISNDIFLRSPIVPNDDSGIELTQLGRVPNQKYDANQSIFWDIPWQKLRAAKSWNILTDLHFLNELFVGRRSKFQLLLFPSPISMQFP